MERLWIPRRMSGGAWDVQAVSSHRRRVDELKAWQPVLPPVSSTAEPIDHTLDVSPSERMRRSRRADAVINGVLIVVHATIPVAAAWLVIRVTAGTPSLAARLAFGGVSVACFAVGVSWFYIADQLSLGFGADLRRRGWRTSKADAAAERSEHRLSVVSGVVMGLGLAGLLASLT